jgi:DNA-binding PadR family transcriptional regulator
MSTTHVVLGLLAAGARHGYEVKRDHDLRLPRVRPLAFGHVYATLGRLVRDGLIEAAGQDRDGGPDRTSYALSPRGRAELTSWLSLVEPPAPYVASVLFSKVMVALLVADEDAARDYLTAQRAAHMARLRVLTAVKTDPSARLADVVAADFAIGHLDADLRWMEATLRRVADLRQEVRR